jgi:hypothetical protein
MAILCENAHVVTLDQQTPVLHGQQILIDRGFGERLRRLGFFSCRLSGFFIVEVPKFDF